jgi:regulator of protease activity HflC (stomatin/prohibitin superfamily)
MFVFGLLLLGLAIVAMLVPSQLFPKYATRSVAGGLALLSFLLIAGSTAIYVNDNEGAVVIVKFGTAMRSDQIVANNGEQGPQAKILPPGWHFFYWPWIYDLEQVPNISIPSGSVGVVEALDGKPLPKNSAYAPEWDSVSDMLDGEKFLAGEGYKGPQLTVLPPGQYRFNPRLFTITVKPALNVKVGEVVVVKANAGKTYDGKDVEIVNGVPMVPNGFRGIWRKALTPDQYYIHPDAYELIHVKTTNRVYSYTNTGSETGAGQDNSGDNHSINVRSKDGFNFPIDVRAAVKISADDAPYVTARIGSPDVDKNQDGYDTLEDIVILPSVRAVFRNGSESHGALEYMNTRSKIEEQASQLIAAELQEYRVDVDGVYIADIGLQSTPEGQELLKTQTDREVAKQEQATWLEKKAAAESRAQSVRADTAATQEAKQVEAEVAIKVAESKAAAEVAMAEGEAQAAALRIEALGGQRNYLLLKMVETAADTVSQKWSGNVPSVVILGEGANLDTAVLSKLIEEQVKEESAPAPVQ